MARNSVKSKQIRSTMAIFSSLAFPVSLHAFGGRLLLLLYKGWAFPNDVVKSPCGIARNYIIKNCMVGPRICRSVQVL